MCPLGQMAKFAPDKFENFFVRHVAGGGDQQVIGREPFAKACLQCFAGKLPDGVGGPENGASERMFRPESAGEDFVQQRFRVVQIHLDFFEDYLALFGDVFGIETRAKAKVRDDVEGDRQVIVENFGVEADLLF